MNIVYNKKTSKTPRKKKLVFPVLLGYRSKTEEKYHIIVLATSKSNGIALMRDSFEINGQNEDWSFGDTYEANVVDFDEDDTPSQYVWEILPSNHKIELSN